MFPRAYPCARGGGRACRSRPEFQAGLPDDEVFREPLGLVGLARAARAHDLAPAGRVVAAGYDVSALPSDFFDEHLNPAGFRCQTVIRMAGPFQDRFHALLRNHDRFVAPGWWRAAGPRRPAGAGRVWRPRAGGVIHAGAQSGEWRGPSGTGGGAVWGGPSLD
ncbi:protein of unknown function [Rhodovastum atsumiense]|nr:protein of unknown function [Rhodovastum atsumiense]